MCAGELYSSCLTRDTDTKLPDFLAEDTMNGATSERQVWSTATTKSTVLIPSE